MNADPSLWKRIFRLPATPLGWWAVGCGAGFLLLFGVMILMSLAGQQGGDTFFANPWLATTALAALTSAMAGGVLAVIAILSKGERSYLDFGMVGAGFVVLFFVLGEILVPH